mgnify:CR=1 FL=1
MIPSIGESMVSDIQGFASKLLTALQSWSSRRFPEPWKALEGLQEIAAVDVAEIAAPREPVRDELGRSYATGKRKDAVARVWIKPGSGTVVVNGKAIKTYFARPVLQMILRQPLSTPL